MTYKLTEAQISFICDQHSWMMSRDWVTRVEDWLRSLEFANAPRVLNVGEYRKAGDVFLKPSYPEIEWLNSYSHRTLLQQTLGRDHWPTLTFQEGPSWLID